MRPVRTFSIVTVITALTTACAGASPAASQGGESQGSEPSQGGGDGVVLVAATSGRDTT